MKKLSGVEQRQSISLKFISNNATYFYHDDFATCLDIVDSMCDRQASCITHWAKNICDLYTLTSSLCSWAAASKCWNSFSFGANGNVSVAQLITVLFRSPNTPAKLTYYLCSSSLVQQSVNDIGMKWGEIEYPYHINPLTHERWSTSTDFTEQGTQYTQTTLLSWRLKHDK